MTLTTVKWTVDDYHRMIDAGILGDRRVELLRGVIVEMAPEGTPHSYFSDRLAKTLQRLLGDRAQIREAKPITLPNDSEPEPDIAIVEPLDEVYLDHHPYPQNIFWLVEYSNSSLAKDMEEKSKVYAESGIEEYWVVDLKNLRLVVFRSPSGAEYTQRNTLTEGAIAPAAFPDVSIEVSRLMRR